MAFLLFFDDTVPGQRHHPAAAERNQAAEEQDQAEDDGDSAARASRTSKATGMFSPLFIRFIRVQAFHPNLMRYHCFVSSHLASIFSLTFFSSRSNWRTDSER